MELKHFIKETLVQIVEGVSIAQGSASKLGAIVSPSGTQNSSGTGGYLKSENPSKDIRHVFNVNFEVGLTSEDNSQNKTGIGVVLGAFSIGASGKSEDNVRSITNVKFTITIVYPVGK